MSIAIADKHGNQASLPRIPTVEGVRRCLVYIEWVESHGKREKMPSRYNSRITHTRIQTWKRTAYGLKHDVEEWNPVSKKFDCYQGYVAVEEFILAAVLCCVPIAKVRGDGKYVDCTFDLPGSA